MLEGIPPDLRSEARQHFYSSLDARSKPGVVIYWITWALVVIPYNLTLSEPVSWDIMMYIWVGLGVVSVLRYIGLSIVRRDFSRQRRLGDWPSSVTMMICSGSWGLLTIFTWPGLILEPLQPVLIITTAGLCAGGVAALSIARAYIVGFILTLLGPCVLTLALHPDPSTKALSLAFLFFALGMFWFSRIQSKQFEEAITATFLLKAQANELSEITMQDSLTGLKNRRFFEARLRQELKSFNRSGKTLNLLLVDVDHFKQVNDRYGHQFGDECLRRVAHVLSDHFQRETDTVARIGGEEFAIVLSNTDRAVAVRMAEEVRQEFEYSAFSFSGQSLKVTVSIGLASLSVGTMMTSPELIKLADMALYKAKHNGRNRVELTVPDATDAPQHQIEI